MRFFACAVLVAASVSVVSGSSPDLLGYLENWNDVKWYDNTIPGKCKMGCFKPQPYIATLAPYASVAYGFVHLAKEPNAKQTGCQGTPTKTPGPCPVWDGKALYVAKATKSGAAAVAVNTTGPTPGSAAMMEAGRMAKMHPAGPKRFRISLGGGGDWARLGSAASAAGVAKLAAKLVQMTYADGLDLDFEHLTAYSQLSGDAEFDCFAALLKALHTELAAVEAQWVAHATQQGAALQKEYDALKPWQQKDAKDYYLTNIQYLKEVAANGAPRLEVSWCTRFNAFVPADNVWNYLLPGTWHPNVTFATDDEGAKIYARSAEYIDTVNIMAYDAGTGMKFNFSTIYENFATLGPVDKEKIIMGFEPAKGPWEGLDADKFYAGWGKDHGYGGAFIWAANPSNVTTPVAAKECPLTAEALNSVLQPVWHWGAKPNFTKCDPTTGWNPSV